MKLIMLMVVVRFKSTVKRLQELKLEIEHLQHLLEMSRVKLMKDFDVWWSEQEHIAQTQVYNGDSGIQYMVYNTQDICSVFSCWTVQNLMSREQNILLWSKV